MIPAVSETASAQQQLRILFVEDSLPDAELCLRELRKAGFEVTADIVQTPEEFDKHLSSNSYDLVLADYNLPRWTGIDALKHLQNQDKGIPFILVTGTLGEETAVECIKHGATDYILKDALTRLPMAIRKALKEKALRDDRKRAEQALRESEARFRSLVETTSDWVWEVNREGQFTYASPKVRELLGYEPEEILGKTPFELMPPDEAERITRVFQEIVASERPFAWLENTNLHKDGRPVVLETNGVPFFDEKGNLLGYRGIDRDITERKRAEQKLRLQATALETAANGILITDREGTIIWANPAFTFLTGYTTEEIIGKNPRILKSGKQDPSFYESLWSTILAGQVWQGEVINRRKDGSLYTEEQTVTPVRDEKGEVSYFVAVKQDVTERKRMEEALRESEVRFRTLAHGSPVGIFRTNATGHCIFLNERGSETIGLSPEEAMGYGWMHRVHPDDRDRVLAEWHTSLEKNIPFQSEYRFERPDGGISWVFGQALPEKGPEGEITSYVGTITDITERKRMEEALRESEGRFRALSEGSPVGIFRTDTTGHCIFINGRGGEIIGLDPEAAMGYGWVQRVHPDDRDRVLADWHTAVEKDIPFQSEHRFEHPDGGITWVFGQALPEKGPAGDITSFIGTITDITDRKRAEEELKSAQLQLIQSAKFESVGRLAAGVAHEVKNPLAIIQYGLGYLSQAFSTTEDDKVAPVLEKMANAVQRADRVIRGLLDFAASSTLEIMPGDLNAVVEQSLQLVHYETVRARVTVVKALAEGLPPIKVDPHKIKQVFVNVFMNAIQAMPHGGTLTVTTAPKSFSALHPGVRRRRTDVFPNGATAVVVEVDDTGSGIPAEKLDRVFDPFFTTKPIGEGTGLGLSVTQNILELHGGIIDIRNRKSGGVCVTLVFPADGGRDDGQEANTAR